MAEKRHRQRRRQIVTIIVALGVALAGTVGVFLAFSGNDSTPTATGSTGASGASGASGATGPSPSPAGKPGKQTGTVDPQAGPSQVACGAEAPKGALKPKPQFNAPKQVLESGRTYTATFHTSCGDIVIELLADQAPATVNSFVFLAEQGFFDATRIHRLDTSIDVIQGGDPTGTGTGGPGYSIPDELSGNESYTTGTLAMANSGSANTGGSQFFLITGPKGTYLDSNALYTIFGRVTKGLDVAQRIQALPVQDPSAGITGQQPKQAVYIDSVTITSTRSG
jgi:cyclophilin family peptidyl-prolyl cis-trans isomerase